MLKLQYEAAHCLEGKFWPTDRLTLAQSLRKFRKANAVVALQRPHTYRLIGDFYWVAIRPRIGGES
jgi:hypothetical protein